jgi:hypothetical protein
MSIRRRGFAVGCVGLSLGVGCTPSAGGANGAADPVSSAGAGGQRSGAGGVSGTTPLAGGSSSTGGQGVVFNPPASGGGTGMPDASCAGSVVSAERTTQTLQIPVTQTSKVPVALYFMVDQSGSMAEAGMTGTKWSTVTDGINAFVNDPASAGLDVGLGFLPPLFGSMGDCTGAGYDTPTVPVAALPGNAMAMSAGLPAAPTGLGTPTEGGLRGAENFCLAYQSQHPDEQCAVVFVTDGQPTSCDTTLDDLVGVAADANTKGILTFAIGMASQNAGEVDFDFLNSVAKAGGTDCNPTNPGNEACDIGGGSDFTTAVATIRKTVTKTTVTTTTVTKTTALACDFQLPSTPPNGQTFDRNKVNVNFTDPSGAPVPIDQAASLADCAKTNANAWYYDDPNTPTKIVLCPNTCSLINAGRGDGGFITGDVGTAPTVGLSFGCQTIIAPPS